MFLLDSYQRFDDKQALATVEASLSAMAQGVYMIRSVVGFIVIRPTGSGWYRILKNVI